MKEGEEREEEEETPSDGEEDHQRLDTTAICPATHILRHFQLLFVKERKKGEKRENAHSLFRSYLLAPDGRCQSVIDVFMFD